MLLFKQYKHVERFIVLTDNFSVLIPAEGLNRWEQKLLECRTSTKALLDAQLCTALHRPLS